MMNMQDKLMLLHEFLNEITYIENRDELDRVSKNCLEKLAVAPEDAVYKLWQDACSLAEEFLLLKENGVDAERSKKLAALTEEEKETLAEVEKVIDENRFDYHFQPIVNSSDGSIYSYEALMRPRSDMKLSPYHIIKYAELKGRLNDVERATLLNVLGRIDSDKEAFGGRKVFINSIPKTTLDNDDLRATSELFMKHSDTVVVELTESAEFDDNELNILQQRYRNMDIKIALDDYGTGYSNVQNLLRYNPNYVKIDRSLLTEIQNSPKKRHFVREIIEFCHANGIMALAEGIETSEELHTVVLLGADLIQGFYTSRPSAELLDTIPYDIRQEIEIYQQERQDGKDQQVYTAGSSERIRLDKLVKDDYKCILVGKDSAENSEVTVIGSPTLETEVHIKVAPDYKGRIVFENVNLSNIKDRPCIELGENCDVTLEINGENKLDKSGILVPESARFALEGEGVLTININGAVEYYGIGNDPSSRHGDLIFDQVGTVIINARGKLGVCVGSGLGGNITVTQGKYVFNINGNTAVGIGALYADTKLDILSCAFDADIMLMTGTAIGSLTGNADVHISRSSVSLSASGKDLSALGTVKGDNASVHVSDAVLTVNMSGSCCTCAGALEKSTSFKVENGAFRAVASGEKAMPYGGISGDVKVVLYNSDTSIDIRGLIDKEKYFSADKFENTGGRTTVVVNGYDVEL